VPRVLANRFCEGNREQAEDNRALALFAVALSQGADRPYRVVDPTDLPNSIRTQLPVQDRMRELLTAISQSEQIISDQNDALIRLRREINERTNSLSFVLAKLLARYWSAVLPTDSRRERVWQSYIRPFVKRLVIGKSTVPIGTAASVAGPASVAGRAATFQTLPQLVSSKGLPIRILVLKLDHIGDLLVSIDGDRVDPATLKERLDEKKIGSIIQVAVLRRNRLMTIPLTVGSHEPITYSIKEKPNATALQKQIFTTWLAEKSFEQ